MNFIKKTFSVEVENIDEENGIIRAIFSSGLPDRDGEMIDQETWNLEEYKKNPVVLWSHDQLSPPIGQMIDIFVNDDKMLEGKIKFAINEYDFANTIYKLYAGKFIRAFSIGFNSEDYEEVNGVRVLKNNTLLEISAVNIPADALALAKSKGINTCCLEKAYKKYNKKSPACRLDDETKNECVARKIPEILDENPDMKQEQAVAIAESLCSKFCSDLEKEKDKKNKETIEEAKKSLEKILKEDKKINYKRALNKAIRELLKTKKNIKC